MKLFSSLAGMQRTAAWSFALIFVSILPQCSSLHVRTVFPANGATDVCPDTPLRIAFRGTPPLASAGTVKLLDASGNAVDTIDLSAPTQTRTIGGVDYNCDTVTVADNVVTLHPHVTLDYGKTYHVVVEPAIFNKKVSAKALRHAGLTDWHFSTKKSGPEEGARQLTVAADGSGDFCTVQAAIDFLPTRNHAPVTILVKHGVYDGLIRIPAQKTNITIRGEDRASTILAGRNNEKLNPGHRDLFFVGGDDFTLENLTVRNTTPKDGSQAEALRIKASRCVLDRVDLFSFQDTARLEGLMYAHDCHIEGDVDFIWGTGAVYFDHCTLKALNGDGFFVQARNPAHRTGYVFVDCRLETAPGVENVPLARVEPKRFPYSQVAFIGCAMGAGILPEGWVLEGKGDTDNLRFWEYGSTDLAGKPLDVSKRLPVSKQLSAEEAAKLRDVSNVLSGWTPPKS